MKLINIIKNKLINIIFDFKINLKIKLDKIIVPKKINIGGGSNFNEFGWINYDINSLTTPVHLNENTIFYEPNEHVNIVYSSHCFEHLNDITVNNILKETFRVLKKKGQFLVIIPDYDFLLNKWSKEDNVFFSQTEKLGFNKHIHFWKNKEIEDNLFNRAAFLFCSYWNEEFAKKYRAFQRKKNLVSDDNKAFWGPPNFDFEKIKNLIKINSPKAIINYLRQEVIDKNNDYTFCHQNAWSKKEFVELVTANKFEILSTDKTKIINKLHFKKIYGLKDHYNLSNYFLFEKC